MDEKRKIVYIVSLGHSGSTLLGNVLGAHSNIYHIGELVAPLVKGRPIICNECLNEESCPIWGKIILESHLRSEYDQFTKWQGSKLKFLKKKKAGTIYDRVFSGLNSRIIVDSSKDLGWYNYQSSSKRYAHYYVFLKREVKAVIASLKRSYGQNINNYIHGVNLQITGLNNFYHSIPNDHKFTITYDDLVNQFEYKVKLLLEMLGQEFEDNQYLFNELPHHIIGGNQAAFIQKSKERARKLSETLKFNDRNYDYSFYGNFRGIKYDDRWKAELTTIEMDEIEEGIKDFDY